ncbi:hypothetical protein WIW50_12305 [Flavobacteriaceae bacterium 3-367]
MDRKNFIKKSALLGGMALSAPYLVTANQMQPQDNLYSTEAILEFVFAAHKSLEETKKIIEAHPLLLNCTSQFKKGDFETAMGGACHMGRRDIAELLLAKGARMDIFNYAFLGYDDFIRKITTDHPHLLNAPGPHGFTLLHHAEVGGRAKLADWLRSKGLTEKMFKGIFG